MTTRLFYMDDSGYSGTGWIIYAWLEVDIIDWRHGLRPWLDFRKHLNDIEGIPVTYELHATKFMNRLQTPSLDPQWNADYSNRWRVITEALDVIASTRCLQAGAVFRHVPNVAGRQYHREQMGVYEKLVRHLDVEMQTQGDLGMIVMDGDGTADSYVTAHRRLKLATRSIIEDPLFQHSHRSQWVQIADLIAYCAYQEKLRDPRKPFAWRTYSDRLTAANPQAEPRAF